MIKMSSIDVKNKIRLNIKEFEEVIVLNEDTSATSLVQELKQMASRSDGPGSKSLSTIIIRAIRPNSSASLMDHPL